MIEILQAIFLGIVEGLTEFLPISSTGHLIIAEDLIGFKDTAEIFTVVIQLGAIMAAAWYFRRDLVRIVRGIRSSDKAMINFATSVIVGLLPAGIVGLIVEKTTGIPDSLWIIALALIAGGLVFLAIERQTHTPTAPDGTVNYKSITPRKGLLVGLGQCLALIPGVSRSGATIMTGLVCGLDRRTATVFSFYLSIPIMVAASGLKLLSNSSAISEVSGGVPALIVGVVVSAITAFFAIKWLLGYVSKHSFRPFAYYRILLGTGILIMLYFAE